VYFCCSLAKGDDQSRLDIGCVAAHGLFYREELGSYIILPHAKAGTAFLLELIARLQTSATVPMIDIRAYARHLTARTRRPVFGRCYCGPMVRPIVLALIALADACVAASDPITVCFPATTAIRVSSSARSCQAGTEHASPTPTLRDRGSMPG
jgi:hypothetical protein